MLGHLDRKIQADCGCDNGYVRETQDMSKEYKVVGPDELDKIHSEGFEEWCQKVDELVRKGDGLKPIKDGYKLVLSADMGPPHATMVKRLTSMYEDAGWPTVLLSREIHSTSWVLTLHTKKVQYR